MKTASPTPQMRKLGMCFNGLTADTATPSDVWGPFHHPD